MLKKMRELGELSKKNTPLTYEGTPHEPMSRETMAISLAIIELRRATGINGSFNSAHEGYAVILEELDELKAEVWKKASKRDKEAMLTEATHVAAMALRFIMDICLKMKDEQGGTQCQRKAD